MIFGETKVLGPYGLVPARELKVGDKIWAWGYRTWQDVTIRRIERGATRRAVIVHYHDGDRQRTIKCGENHVFKWSVGGNVTARHLKAGDRVLMSEGDHRFFGTVGPIERVELDEPEAVYDFDVDKRGRTALIEGFLCQL